MMSYNLLSKIENGCFGKMKLEDGKLVFECIQPPLSPPPSHYTPPPSSPPPSSPPPSSPSPPSPPPSPPPHQVPVPSAPLLVEDNRVIIEELRDELRETKERLAVLEAEMKKADWHRMNWRIERARSDIEKLYSFRETVLWMPNMSRSYEDLYDFNTEVLHFSGGGGTYYVNICDKAFCQRMTLEDRLKMVSTQLRRDRIRNIVIQPNQTVYSYHGVGEMTTPSCVKVIRFILDWVHGGWYKDPTILQITITSNTNGVSSVGFVVSLCEQLKPESPVKIVITQARISEQTELKNKVDKDVFKKIEFEKVVSSA
jgi:hypothetical protein